MKNSICQARVKFIWVKKYYFQRYEDIVNIVYRILGVILIVSSGFIYTLENIAEKISANLVASGYVTTGIGTDRPYNNIGFFDNFFVWLLFFIGSILLVYGFPNKNRKIELYIN